MMHFVMTSLLLMGSCTMFKGFKQDALIEEITEDLIKSETGLDLDLSPQSKE